MSEITHISQLTHDPKNARSHNPRNIGQIVDSLQEVGAARSIVIDEHGRILAGNGTIDAAGQAGIERVQVVDADGETIVAVRRTGLTDAQKTRLALADNRTSELATWDPAILAELNADNVLDGLFRADEIDALLASLNTAKSWAVEDDYSDPGGDGVDVQAGYRLASIWYGMTKENEVRPYMLNLPMKKGVHDGATVKLNYSRTNAEETERIVKTYMRPGDRFYEMCCGWMTFSSTAKYYGFSGRGSDIWDVSLEFCKRQIDAMPGDGVVDVVNADCRETGEPENTYDFVHSNPPFFSLEPYGGQGGDLAALGSYERWLDAMAEMGVEAARILKPGGLANFVINDYREEGRLIPMHADFTAAIGRNSGLVLHDCVIAEVISQALRFRRHDYERRRTVKCHEYIITFRKPGAK